MAAWEDILRATLEAAGKSADEIEKIIAKIAGGMEKTAAVAETTATKSEASAAEIAKMSKAERAAYNAAQAAKGKEVTDAAAALSRARGKFKNVKEGEDVINATLSESLKTKMGQEGLQQQFDQYFKKAEVANPSRVLKRTLNDPDYLALKAAEDKAVAKAQDDIMAKIEEAKSAGKPMTEDQIRTLVSSKSKEIADSVAAEFKLKSAADIEAIKSRAAEGNRALSKREKDAIAAKEKASFSSAKERAQQISEQAGSVAKGGNASIDTRVRNLKELTPEEQRMSGVKAKLYKEKAVAQSKGQEAFITKLERMAADKNLKPVLDKDGKQVMEEIIVDGEKMTVPKYETRAEQNLRVTEEKKFVAKNVQEAGDGKPAGPPKTVDEKLNEAATKASTVTDSAKKLAEQQKANILKGAEEAAAASNSPAAKAALEQIKKDFGRGKITEQEYLQKLKGVPKITGEAVTNAEVAANEYNIKAQKIRSGQVQGQLDAKLEEKFGKGYTTKAGESGSTQFVPAEVPVSQLKGRKWVRDASGKLVLAKK